MKILGPGKWFKNGDPYKLQNLLGNCILVYLRVSTYFFEIISGEEYDGR